MKRWIVPKYSKELVNTLAEECDIDPFLALIAVVRGFSDPIDLDAFLSCEDVLDSPFTLTDMQAAADCVNNAIADGMLIAIYGDYDCDGVTSTALLYMYLASRGANVIYYIPDRADEGYGMNRASVDKLYGMGAELIITVDNGINAAEEISYARSLGISVVVTDHHIPAGEIPKADAVVNPCRADDTSDFKTLSGVGVAFMLACAAENAEPEELLPRYADLVALGTVADIMPLIGANRVFVREGLGLINASPRLGIAALTAASGLGGKALNAGNLAFNLAPRINAAGRMGDASRAVRLLCSDSMEQVSELADELDRENAERQRMEAVIEKQAIEIIECDGLNYDRVIVVNGDGWHKGIVGIAAARLTERYGRPVIVLSTEGELSVGSGRSVEGFSLFDAISVASDRLCKFGGHELAAGLTLKTEDIPYLRECVNTYALKKPICVPSVMLDCKLRPAALSVEMGELISVLAPFGKGNQNPLFGIYSLKIERITAIGGGKHLRLLLSRDGTLIQALMFGSGAENFPYQTGDTVDVAVNLDVTEYRGEKQLSVIIREIRPSGESEIDFETFAIYNDFYAGVCKDTSAIRPSREETGTVFRCCANPVWIELLVTKLCGKMPRGKVLAAADILCEIGILKKEMQGGRIVLSQIAGARSNFESSDILRRLKEGETE